MKLDDFNCAEAMQEESRSDVENQSIQKKTFCVQRVYNNTQRGKGKPRLSNYLTFVLQLNEM